MSAKLKVGTDTLYQRIASIEAKYVGLSLIAVKAA